VPNPRCMVASHPGLSKRPVRRGPGRRAFAFTEDGRSALPCETRVKGAPASGFSFRCSPRAAGPSSNDPQPLVDSVENPSRVCQEPGLPARAARASVEGSSVEGNQPGRLNLRKVRKIRAGRQAGSIGRHTTAVVEVRGPRPRPTSRNERVGAAHVSPDTHAATRRGRTCRGDTCVARSACREPPPSDM
jgi:hypothetical protein